MTPQMRLRTAGVQFAGLLVVLNSPLVPAVALSAQVRGGGPPVGVQHVAAVATNALLSGITSAAFAGLRGEQMDRAFVAGIAGGSISYVGKFVAVQEFPAAPFLGQQIAATGHSIVGNVSSGRHFSEEFRFPVGPVRLTYRPTGPHLRILLDVSDAVILAYAVVQQDLRFDLEHSIALGTPVFTAHRRVIESRGRVVDATTIGGVVLVSHILRNPRDVVLRHEVVHVIQNQQLYSMLAEPLEREALEAVGLSWPLLDYLQINVIPSLIDGSWRQVFNAGSPLSLLSEAEAELLVAR